MRRRVKITGIGPVTPAGIGREAFFRGINEPVSHVRLIDRFDPEAGVFIGAEIPDFDLLRYAPGLHPKRISRHAQFGLVGAILALQDAGLAPEELGAFDPMIITGTSIMDIDRISRGVQVVAKKGPRYSLASTIYETSVVNVAGKIAEYLEVPLRMFSLQTSCCSGLDAIGHAVEMIASGQTDLAIAGGSEAPLTFHPLLEFNAADLNPTARERPGKACRPFDLWRSTGVLGEGAAIMILEPEGSPRPPYAWITGYGFANDNNAVAGLGIAGAIKNALANSGRRAQEIDFVNAWGPGHRLIDANEALALKKVFGPRLAEIACVSIKGSVGTPLGASGAIQTASTALSLARGIIPPTVNWETFDPGCPLNLSAAPRHLQPSVAVVDAHGLSGVNAALVLERICQQ
jgi:3-oxoacyl-(acyl-carrier-protein) synthase